MEGLRIYEVVFGGSFRADLRSGVNLLFWLGEELEGFPSRCRGCLGAAIDWRRIREGKRKPSPPFPPVSSLRLLYARAWVHLAWISTKLQTGPAFGPSCSSCLHRTVMWVSPLILPLFPPSFPLPTLLICGKTLDLESTGYD